MTTNIRKTALRSVVIAGITALTVLCMFYPFLPGEYDALAVALSNVAQAGGAVGLLFVPVCLFRLVTGRRARYFDLAAVIVSFVVAAVMTLVAFATIGPAFGVLTVALLLCMAFRLRARLASLNTFGPGDPTPLYLILIPIAIVLAQVISAAALTERSRNRAIANSSAFIQHIEGYRARHGRYPASLLAQWKDYSPGVVGVEKYHYAPHGDSYNLFFEQPRFLFDNPGTREWVVYNPRDEHRVYSHTAWLLLFSPEEQDRTQGWYAVHETAHPHWKSFWFD